MSFRGWLSIITVVALGLIVYFSRHEIYRAWQLLETVDIWILLLLIPVQLIVYFAAGEMMFAYLRDKKETKEISGMNQARMALEMNFVNHILPSGGVSGISYMSWRLGHYGIAPSRSTAAQFIRYMMGFFSLVFLLILSVFFVTIDSGVNRVIILLSSVMVFFMIISVIGIIYLVGSQNRMEKTAAWLVRVANKIIGFVSFGKIKRFARRKPIIKFFDEIHKEYVTLRKNQKLLRKPFLWGIVFNALDVSLFALTFLALGHPVNPAPILIAYGLSSLAGFIVITPGGAGAYEAIMVAVLATAGVPPGVAIAGILLTRVFVLLTTIVLGYFFYQHAILRYGKTSGKFSLKR